MMRITTPIFVAIVMFLSGCVGNATTGHPAAKLVHGAAQTASQAWIPQDVKFDTSGKFAKPIVVGPYHALPPVIIDFPSLDGVRVQSAVWRPDVPEGTKVPVIIDVGPYYGDAIEKPLSYIAPLHIEGIVPFGYAWAQVAVRGTAGSGGCQELFSANEQKDVEAAVEYYGSQPWSNGNVALTGISYDGTTTWIGAQFGNPHLKTIVPIAGLSSIYDHGVRNGTPWLFEPALHANYWPYGFETNRRSPQDKAANVCPEIARSLEAESYATITGERTEPPGASSYWSERDFKPKILANYHGSVFYINGLFDWRVPAYEHFPFIQDMQAKGIPTKIMLGQWWHDMPDNIQRKPASTIRWDYAEMLLHWYQKYLYDTRDENTGPAAIVEDDNYAWRDEANWPPPDLTWIPYQLGAGVLKEGSTAAGSAVVYSPANAYQALQDNLPPARAAPPVPTTSYRATTGPLPADLRFAGLPRMPITFVPTSPLGARIAAELRDRDPSGAEKYVARAVMDLRFYEGGYTSHVLTPGTPIVAKMEFMPTDAMIPKGHELVLVITNAGYSTEVANAAGASGNIDQYWESPTPLPVQIQWGDGKSVLQLPVIQRDIGDGKYVGQP